MSDNQYYQENREKLIQKSKDYVAKAKKVKLVCKNCNNEYEKIPHKVWNSKFCSKGCGTAHRNKKNTFKVDKVCKNCNKKFKVVMSRHLAGNGKFCSHSCSSTWNYKYVPQYNKRTGIEIKMAELLTKIGIEFEEQKSMPEQKCIPDFYLPKHNIFLFADGDFWHRTKRRQFCDARINKRLAKAGYHVLRYWENDINNNINWVASDIKNNLTLCQQLVRSSKSL